MSQIESSRVLIKRLNYINKTIDRRIIEGLSYKKEAKQHKELLAKLSRTKKESWSMKLASSFAMFL